MEQQSEFVDLLRARRKNCDILWATRPMNPLKPHKLPPESKYTRSQIIQAVLNNAQVKLAIYTVAAVRQVNVKDVMNDARMIINEMASKADLVTVRWIGLIITKVLKRILMSIYINENAIFKMKKEMQIFQVQYVYAPSHRSYLDFILLSYILFSYDMALPNIASGMDFYQMHIIGELLRKTGAFYIQRSFSNNLLYKRIFSAYIMSLTKNSDRAIEFFIEGTRSRSLKSLTPKFGLLSIILESVLNGGVPDIHFVPIGINYERPPEELLFAYELLGVPKPKESTTGLLQSLSVLQKPYAYGRVVFNIGVPIPASQFLNVEYRKAKILSPHTKLPTTVTEKLAYCIIDSHIKNTILMPFNVIAILFNERTQKWPDNTYTLDTLVTDYSWCKSLLIAFSATVYVERNEEHTTSVEQEVLNTLQIHNELLSFDASNILRLKERHRRTKLTDNIRVKGHMLSEKTMSLAVSVINISIYLNPTLSFLVKPAIATVAIGMNEDELGNDKNVYFNDYIIHNRPVCDRICGILGRYYNIHTTVSSAGTIFKKYSLLRTLLSTEFAMPLIENESILKLECEEVLNLLANKNVISIKNNVYAKRKDAKTFSLLYNVILPFIDTVYVTCLVLFEWNESELDCVTKQKVLIEVQKQIEEAFLKKHEWGQHPYSLSLDLINSTISNLVAQGILVPSVKRNMYQVDKIQLALILAQLENLSLKRPLGSYLNIVLLPALPPHVSAKL